MSKLSIYMLGAPRLELDSRLVEPDTRKATALLAYLAITGERHTRDKLAVLLWPEYDQSRSKAALRRTLSALKSTVSGYGLDIQRDSLGLEPAADIWVDVLEFRRLLRRCQEHGHPADEACPACLTPLKEAVDLYRGDFLAGFSLRDSVSFDEWQYLEGERLRRELAQALKNIAQCLGAQGQYVPAIEYAQRHLELDPLSEEAHRLLMRLFTLDEQRASALRQYRDCVHILDEELGVAPLEKTTALYEGILRGELFGETEKQVAEKSVVRERPELISSLPLVGRAAEWAALLDWYEATEKGGRFVVLEGEAGIGKSRLAQAFLDYVRLEGGQIIASQCFDGESDLAYTPFVEALSHAISASNQADKLKALPPHWLVEVSRLVPDVATLRSGLPSTTTLDGPGAQNRFFEAISQVLLALCRNSRPGVLFLDDLHWCDEASMDLLSYFLRRLHNSPLFVLVTWRSEQLSANHQLRQTLASAQRAGYARPINLGRLDEIAVRELVQSAAGTSKVEEQLVRRLHEETEGLPYFLIEYLASLDLSAEELELPIYESGADSAPSLPMPVGVRGLLRSRLGAVDETGHQLLQTAAVIGRSFDFDALREASGRGEEETIAALENLLARGLVVERSSELALVGERITTHSPGIAPSILPFYDFSHQKLRDFVYQETSLARRRLLHRRVAQVLVTRLGPQRDIGRGSYMTGLVAYHYRRAGLEEMAAGYYKQAGDQARELFANAEALAHYQAALALGYDDPVYLQEAIGELHTLRGEYDEALASFEAAAASLDPSAQPELMARLETKLGGVYHRRGDWALAASQFQQAWARLIEDGPRARLLTDWSLTSHQSGDDQKAQEQAEKAINLAQAADDPQALALAHNIMGILANSQGEANAACQHLEESLALAELLQDPAVKIAALNNLSLARRTAGDMDRAIQLGQQALALCMEVGDRHREAALHNNLADLLHATGQPDEAMAHLKRSVTIYADIGGEKHEWRPEIWKLTEW